MPHPGDTHARRPPTCATAREHAARQLRRPLRRAHPGHDGLGDPRAVLGGQPARGRLARRVACRTSPGCRSTWSATRSATWCATSGTVAMQYGSGQGDPRLREQICDVMRLEGIEAHPDDVVVTVGSQQAVDLVTRIFCDPGDVVICEAPSYVGALGVFRPTRSTSCTSRWTTTAWCPSALREAIAHGAGQRPADQVPLHDPELPQPRRRHAVGASAARRSSRSAARPTCWSSRTTPTACSASTSEPLPRAAGRRGGRRDLPRLVLQDVRARLPGRLGAGAARRPREAGARPGVRDAVPAGVLASSRSRPTSRPTTGWGRSSSSGRCTASGATRWSSALDDMMPRDRAVERARPAGSTCG